MYKLGKLPARVDSVKLKLASYKTVAVKIPAKFGHQSLVPTWGMLGNDQYGDCVWAGAGHETILWNKEAGRTISITDKDALSDYSAVTGFNPNDPNSDQGTDMQVAASYRKKTGIKSENGRHTISAYLGLRVADEAEMKQAIYLFSGVGLGFNFPDYAMDEFNAGQTWHVKSGPKPTEGHYVAAVGYDSTYVYVITWGKIQKMTWGFFKKYNDESIVYLSQEMLSGSKSLEGYDFSTLQADISKL